MKLNAVFFCLLYSSFLIAQSGNAASSNFINNQKVKKGEDGFVSLISHINVKSEPQDGLSVIFVNGMANQYADATTSSYDISGILGRKVLLYYSKTSIEYEDGLISLMYNGITDIKDAFNLKYQAVTDVVRNLNSLILKQTNSGFKIRIFAHSRGAALIYSAVSFLQETYSEPIVKKIFDNLEIITIGGFSPPSHFWPCGVNVIDINNNYDAVAALAGKHNSILSFLSFSEHPVNNYYKYLSDFKLVNINQTWRTNFKK